MSSTYIFYSNALIRGYQRSIVLPLFFFSFYPPKWTAGVPDHWSVMAKPYECLGPFYLTKNYSRNGVQCFSQNDSQSILPPPHIKRFHFPSFSRESNRGLALYDVAYLTFMRARRSATEVSFSIFGSLVPKVWLDTVYVFTTGDVTIPPLSLALCLCVNIKISTMAICYLPKLRS